jgi:hypothetical protein
VRGQYQGSLVHAELVRYFAECGVHRDMSVTEHEPQKVLAYAEDFCCMFHGKQAFFFEGLLDQFCHFQAPAYHALLPYSNSH